MPNFVCPSCVLHDVEPPSGGARSGRRGSGAAAACSTLTPRSGVVRSLQLLELERRSKWSGLVRASDGAALVGHTYTCYSASRSPSFHSPR